jgi:hypothetical protein
MIFGNWGYIGGLLARGFGDFSFWYFARSLLVEYERV